MNNLLRVLTESQVQLQTPEPEFKLLLNAVKEARRQNNDTKQSDAFYDSLEGLLHDLRTVTMDNHDAEAFLKPVTKSEVPDYYDIISQPMDLQTMLKKVKQKQYKSKREFEDDLDLIWSNCFTYNSTENHPLRQCATRLKAKADKLLKNITDRKERADPPIPDLQSRGSTPRVNGVNGHVVGRARPVAFTKSPTPSKPHVTVNGKVHRRDASPTQEQRFERTAEGMAAFLRLDRELDARLREEAAINGLSGPSLEELLLEYSPPPIDEEGETSSEGGVGEKRKMNGYSEHRPRKRAKMGHSDPVELWWDAMQSDAMIANGVPILRHSRSDDPPQASSSQTVTDPPRMPGQRPRKKRRKASSDKPGKDTLLHHMNNNITTLRKVRNTHARLTALKESSEDNAGGGVPQQLGMQLAGPDEPESLMDDRPWRTEGSGIELGEQHADDCIHWMGNKVLEHVGFQGASKTALDVLAGVTSDYLYNVGRTIRYLCDKYSNKMTPEEIILHTLFESGVTRIHDLERYIKDDVVRYGGRLTELEKKLTAAYEEATVGEAWDDEALFRMEDEEEDNEFVMGNFADSYGEDFFGLRELGIADELGLSTLTVPKKLLRGKKGGPKLEASAEPKEPPPPFPPPPPFVQLDSNRIDDQIGLLKRYYQHRVDTLAAATAAPPPTTMYTNSPSMPPPPHPFNPSLPGMPLQPAPTITVSVHPPTGELPPMPFTSSFGPGALTPPPPHLAGQLIVLPDDAPSTAHTKLGPIGQVLKSAPAAANASKKKAAPKPKAPPDGDAGAGPETPMTTAGTPTATAVETPKKNKGAGAGKKKKATTDVLPIIMTTSF